MVVFVLLIKLHLLLAVHAHGIPHYKFVVKSNSVESGFWFRERKQEERDARVTHHLNGDDGIVARAESQSVVDAPPQGAVRVAVRAVPKNDILWPCTFNNLI